MTQIFGADSRMPANTRLTNGYTLYDWVMRMSCFPSFWGRSLIGEKAVTKEEIDFLHSKHCKVALILRDLKEEEISINEDFISSRAIEAARALDIPQNKGIAIFAEIDTDYSVNHNWMIRFASTMNNSGYIPGFIGNTDSSKNFNFGRQCSHYVQATRSVDQLNALYWSTEPKYKFDPYKWATYAPSELLPKDMHLWQYGSVDFHNVHANKSYARDASVMKHFY